MKAKAVVKTQPEVKERVRRTPINGRRQRLTVSDMDPDFHYRVVNDVDDKVASLEENGYTVVTDPKHRFGDKRVATPTAEGSVRTVSVGQGTTGVLMRIRKDWYKEDQAAKQREIDEVEQTIKRDALQGEGRYGQVEFGRKV